MDTEMKVTLVCTKCGEEKSTEDFNKNKASKSGFRSECKACKNVINKIHYQENREELIAYRQNNKERRAAYDKLYLQNNPHKNRAKSSRRRAKKIQATPTWTSQLQKLQIESLYNESVNLERLTGVRYHLDHIHPLNSKYICGLELPCNFQILTGPENCSKSNKFEPYVHSELDINNLLPWQKLDVPV